MELHMQSHHWQARLPDWAAAAIAGFGAGGVMMLLEVLWAVTAGADDPWRPTHMVAAMAMGWDALQTTGYSLAIAASFGKKSGTVTTAEFDDASLQRAMRSAEEIARLVGGER